MGIFAELAIGAPREQRSNLTNPAQWLVNWATGGSSAAGPVINQNTARTIPTVYACVNAIASDLATLPIKVYRRDSDTTRTEVHNNAVRYLLNVEPNPHMTAATFRRTLQSHRLLWGFALVEIEYDLAGRPLYLWPLSPERVRRIIDKQGRFAFEYTMQQGGVVTLLDDEVLHFPNMSDDGRVGLSIIGLMRDALGIIKSQQNFSSKFYEGGVKVSGVFKHPKALSDKAYERLKAELKKHSDPENSAGTMILEEDMDFQHLTMPLKDAEFIDSLGYGVDEICRMFRVPPHKVQKLDRATFSNIEHQAIEYVTDTLRPYMVLDEQEINRKLLAGSRAGELYCEYSADALLRGDIKSRYEAYSLALNVGFLNRDQVAAKENMNPLPDGQGKVYTVPANVYNLEAVRDGEAGVQKLGTASGTTDEPKRLPSGKQMGDDMDDDDMPMRSVRGATEAVLPVLEDALSRVLRVEADKAARAQKSGKLAAWAGEFYGQDHADHVRAAVFPALDAAEAVVAGTLGAAHDPAWKARAAGSLALWHVGKSRDMCGQPVNGELAAWFDGRAEKDAPEMAKMLAGFMLAAWRRRP